jgi:hypothetical protein
VEEGDSVLDADVKEFTVKQANLGRFGEVQAKTRHIARERPGAAACNLGANGAPREAGPGCIYPRLRRNRRIVCTTARQLACCRSSAAPASYIDERPAQRCSHVGLAVRDELT